MKQQIHEFLLRLKSLFTKRRLDRDMADELAFHQEMLTDKLVRQGVSRSEADQAARRRFGNSSRWHERLRELWQFRWIENLKRDAGFSVRVLRKSPGFTAVAILTMALGVGANTTVFSIVNALMLRPLPVPDSDRLVVLGIAQGRPTPGYTFSEPLFRGLEDKHQVFESVFAFTSRKAQIKSNSGSESANVQMVSGDFFNGLEATPILGRVLARADDIKGGDPAGFAAVISEGFWQRWFDRNPNVVGQKLHVDDAVFTVVGVTPKRFIGANPLDRPEIFVPLAAEPAMNGARSITKFGVHAWWMTTMARLQPGATLQQANAQLATISDPVLRQSTTEIKWIVQEENKHFHFLAEPGSAGFTYVRLIFKQPLAAVFAMCGGVLLLACLNLASLLTARGAARQRELATRFSMGATRGRLLQQLLVDSLLISLAGTIAGLAVSPAISKALANLLVGGQVEISIDTSLDIRVFVFAAIVAMATTFLVGLMPALQATSGNLSDQMKQGQNSTKAQEHRRILPRVMMAFEVALALMLVVGAGLLASSLVRLYSSGAGFDPRGVENIAISMDHQPLRGEALMQFYQQVGESLLRQPGVRTVSWASVVPLSNVQWDESFYALGGKEQDLYENSVGPDYFKAMRIAFFDGRDFRWDDTTAGGPKVILNRAAASLLFPDRNPIGQTINQKNDGKVTQYEVIGEVGDAKYSSMRTPPPPTVYHPITQDDGKQSLSYQAVVRVDGSPTSLPGATRSILRGINPEIPAPVMSSMSTTVDESLSAERTMALLSVFFAICALIVTAIGLYGTLAYSTARRTSEIGIRMALGAKRTQVAWMIFLQNTAVASVGTVSGLVCALLASRALNSFLYATSAREPWIYAASIAILALIASAASLIPAWRAAQINPMQAIRCE